MGLGFRSAGAARRQASGPWSNRWPPCLMGGDRTPGYVPASMLKDRCLGVGIVPRASMTLAVYPNAIRLSGQQESVTAEE